MSGPAGDETEYYRSILDNLSGGLLSVDPAGRVIYANPTAARILHLAADGVLGKPYDRALAPYPALCAVIRQTLDTHNTVRRAEVSVLHGDTEMIIGYSTLQVRNRRGESLGIGLIFQDLTLVKPRDGARA
ncbi:MAG: PAS domain-containing protein [Elusimicrobia bacterium]|nr:PAS domain-containing protein [Elusimicrobiota bacterium]